MPFVLTEAWSPCSCNQGGGGEGQGEQRCCLRTKALMRNLGTRIKRRQRVFVRTGKGLWK